MINGVLPVIHLAPLLPYTSLRHCSVPTMLRSVALYTPSVLSKEQSNELRAELNMLLERVVSDRNRIREIGNRLLTTS